MAGAAILLSRAPCQQRHPSALHWSRLISRGHTGDAGRPAGARLRRAGAGRRPAARPNRGGRGRRQRGRVAGRSRRRDPCPDENSASTVAATVHSSAPPSAKAAAQQTVWVILKSQANAGPAAKGKTGRARARPCSLADLTASSSQAGLKSFLSPRREVQSFWIVNTLKVTADQQTIDEIAKRSDVANVVPDRASAFRR